MCASEMLVEARALNGDILGDIPLGLGKQSPVAQLIVEMWLSKLHKPMDSFESDGRYMHIHHGLDR